MKILMINSVCGVKSTGRICTDLAKELEKNGHEVKIAYGRERVPLEYQKYAIRIGNNLNVKIHGLQSRLFDMAGFGSKKVTQKFIEWVKEYNPDVIHLHNIHGYYINVEVLFQYLKKEFKGKIIWTLHDCWAFTGHCAYFDYVRCEEWKKECKRCVQKKEYPKCIGISNSNNNFFKKKQLFTGIDNLIIVTPSQWLAGLVKNSFLKEYKVKVIHNGIDTKIFKKIETDIKSRYNLKDKKIILGVAAIWDRRKGLDYFIELSNKLDNSYQIVVIGITKEQKQQLPQNIIGILKTSSIKELIEWYSAADVFVNPTLEDNYPTTNLEAIACGTPVITYDTGGSIESANMFGKVIKKNNIIKLIDAIKNIDKIKIKNIDIDYKNTVQKYIFLYKEK